MQIDCGQKKKKLWDNVLPTISDIRQSKFISYGLYKLSRLVLKQEIDIDLFGRVVNTKTFHLFAVKLTHIQTVILVVGMYHN